MTELLSEETFTADWSSMTYGKVFGSCVFTIPKNYEDLTTGTFRIKCEFKYDPKSQYRPGAVKLFELNALIDNMRIVAQMDLGTGQLFSFTFNFKNGITSGFYSSLYPIDCGGMRPRNQSMWKTIFCKL
jgi:hypothetical protein